MIINLVCFAIILIVSYIFWLRPILKRTSSLTVFWDREGSFFAALAPKFAGIKQKLASAIMIIASASVEIWNFIGPAISGVDTSKLTDMVPGWAWPLIAIAGVALLNYFRTLADSRNVEVLEQVQDKVQEGISTGVFIPQVAESINPIIAPVIAASKPEAG